MICVGDYCPADENNDYTPVVAARWRGVFV